MVSIESEAPPGSDRDEHGCIGSAGYVWCESKQKCIRPWEEDCPETPKMCSGTIYLFGILLLFMAGLLIGTVM